MKLSNEALAQVIEIFRKGILELADVSQLLRELELAPDADGHLAPLKNITTWRAPTAVTG